MSSRWRSALASLDDSLALLRESLGKLEAAQSINIVESIEQFNLASESARNLRGLVLSELPEASWQNREELGALLQEMQKRVDARHSEQLRFHLLALATELERGRIVHRRALRVNQLNQFREQAIKELRSRAGLDGTPQTLPGPEADEWIEWAFALKEPEDAESLQILRNGFAHLDDFVAHLEPDMWIAAESPTLEILPQPETSADKTLQEQPRLETNGFEEPLVSSGPIPIQLKAAQSSGGRDQPRLLDPRDELPPRGLESNTLTPHDVTPPRTEEENQRLQAQERALLAGMMGLVSDPVAHFDPTVEHTFTAAVFRETSVAPANLVGDRVGHFSAPVERPLFADVFRETSAATGITSHIRTRAAELWGGKLRRLLRNR